MANGNSKTILTNSAISAFKACPRKYYWRYIQEIEALERPEALLLGTAIHAFLECHYRQLPYTLHTGLTPKSQAILKGTTEGYEAEPGMIQLPRSEQYGRACPPRGCSRPGWVRWRHFRRLGRAIGL